MTHYTLWLIGILLATALFACGCDGISAAHPASSSTTEATVRGKVVQRGKPLANVEIRFNPANVNRKAVPMRSATTAADGSYEIATLIGENIITLGVRPIRKFARLHYAAKILDVKEGDNSFDLELR
jgi:hypothetical protein